MAEELKMPLQRFRFIKDPARGVFLDVAVRMSGEDVADALKTLKALVASWEEGGVGVPKSVTEDGTCFAMELEMAGAGPFMVVTMQDGGVHKTEKKPDGTYETFEEVVERKWSAAEIRRAAQGRG